MIRLLLFVFLTNLGVAQVPRLKLIPVLTGLNRPTDLVILPDQTMLVGQTNGQIRLIRNGVLEPTPFLDLGNRIFDPTWNGIFGLTVHPDYATNGYVYVHYADRELASVFARFTQKPGNPNEADPASEQIILRIPYPNGGHRSGQLAFGPDGYLYLTTGDSSLGGRGPASPADQQAQNKAQDMSLLYGKLLRIDVDGGHPYRIPPTNPYAAPDDGIRDEILAAGLRNPWRWSFDRLTGDFWLGDIGQDGWDELNWIPSGTLGRQNFGWPCYEGSHAYRVPCVSSGPFTPPFWEYPGYDNNGGKAISITGGFVYRGSAFPDLRGWYVLGDYVQGTYWTLNTGALPSAQPVAQTVPVTTSPIAFAQSAEGELYVLSFADGALYQLGTEPVVSVRSGAWADPATWDCHCLPAPGATVRISKGHSVSLDSPVQVRQLLLEGDLMVEQGGQASF